MKDTNECLEEKHNCSPNAKCINSMGNFSCVCHEGYHGNGNTCTGIYLAYILLLLIF